jgi:NADPH2:quinone reductase
MRVLGIDFTSTPRRSKPITCLNCTFDGRVLRAGALEEWPDFSGFEEMLQRPGPWIAGIDFPFGQSRKFIETMGWPADWRGYVTHARSLGRKGFRDALNSYRQLRSKGDKEHRRQTDIAAGSISPQKLYRVPVGLMFFEGAPRLAESGITIPHLQTGDPSRIVVEAYPGLLARRVINGRSYKQDSKKKQTPAQRKTRSDLFRGLREAAPYDLYGIEIDAPDTLCEDPSGDHIDALLCAIQAAWAWQNREKGYGAPSPVDSLEGWIADPSLSLGAVPAPPGEHNRVVQVKRFGGPDELEVVDATLPTAGRGEVRVRVLASSVEYTDVVIRRHLYPWVFRWPPFVMGYDVVGEIDQLGDGVTGLHLGDRVADMTVLGSNAAYRTLRADHVTRVPAGVDAAEAAALILSWTTAYQLLHRAARVQRGERVLVQGAAGAVGQALLALGRMASLELWGTARRKHAALVRELGATPIDYQREDFTRVLPGGFDVVFDGIGEEGYRRSFAALKRGGLLCAYGYTAGVQAQRRMLTMLMWVARLYLWRWLPGGKRACGYSINIMRARHPAWFREDLKQLFGLLATRAIQPRVAERISFDEVAEAHRRLEAGGLEGKLVLCPDLPSRRDRVPPKPEPRPTPV